MRDGVEVGGDELAALVLVDAQLGVLDLVVVDVAVETNHHSAHVVVVLQREACALPTSLVRMRFQSTGVVGWLKTVRSTFGEARVRITR